MISKIPFINISPINKMTSLEENKLSYYAAKLLKEALREMGYVFPKNITKKELIQFIVDLIQQSHISDSDYDDSSDDDSSSDDEDHRGLVFKCAYGE
jgi:hypothetical protein